MVIWKVAFGDHSARSGGEGRNRSCWKSWTPLAGQRPKPSNFCSTRFKSTLQSEVRSSTVRGPNKDTAILKASGYNRSNMAPGTVP